MTRTQSPIAEDLGTVVSIEQAIAHLEQAEPHLASISDHMAYLARTMIDELKVQARTRKPEE